MSAIERIKAQMRAQNKVRREGGGQVPTNLLYHQGNEIIVIPQKSNKKRKLMEVQKEHKESMDRMPSKNHSLAHPKKKEDEMDDEEVEEDDTDNSKPKQVPWGPAELLSHLDKPEVVGNLNRVIQLVKQKDLETPVTDEERRKGNKNKKKKELIVWDHSQSPMGKESDNNFFHYLQAYCAHEDKICQQQENAMFE